MGCDPSPHGFSTLQQDYLCALTAGSGRAADRVVEAALDLELAPQRIYLDIFQPTAYDVGLLWQANRISVAGEHLATAILERQMGELHPLFRPSRERGRTIVLGCVPNEWHRVGARMVADFFEADGWAVHYLGANVPVGDLVRIARESHADLIGISTAMLFNLTRVAELVQALEGAGLGGIPVIGGGMPFITQPGLALALNLRGSAANAEDALLLANRVLDSTSKRASLPSDLETARVLAEAREALIRTATAACVVAGDTDSALIAAGYGYVLRMVEAALVAGSPALLDNQISWAHERQPHDGVTPEQLLARLNILAGTLHFTLSDELCASILPYLHFLIARQRRIMGGV